MVREGVAARRSGNYGRARVSTVKPDIRIVQENLDREWRVGTFLAGMAFALVIGPLVLMHAAGWF